MSRLRWSIGLLVPFAAGIVLLWVLSSMPWVSNRAEPAVSPASELFTTRSFGRLEEASVFLESHVVLATVVDMSLFGGLAPGTTPEAAAEFLRVPPSGRAKDDVWFRTPKAELHVWYSPNSAGSPGQWLLYAVPTRNGLNDVIINPALHSQLRALLPKARSVSIGIRAGDGATISIQASQSSVEKVYLGPALPGSA